MAKNPCFYNLPIRDRETRIPQGLPYQILKKLKKSSGFTAE